jgi:hypothetical protein
MTSGPKDGVSQGETKGETKDFIYEPPMPVAVYPINDCPHCTDGDHLMSVATTTVDSMKNDSVDRRYICEKCQHEHENWICMCCKKTFCGRHVRGHMVDHFQLTGHCVALGWSDLSFWCFHCDAYLDAYNIPNLKPLYSKYHYEKFGEVPPGMDCSGGDGAVFQEGMTLHLA